MAFSNGYEYRKKITIDNTQVPSSQVDFPVLISETDSDLASVANGGKVEYINDILDVRFEATDGTKLAYEAEKYDETTGELVAWVKVPALSSSTDTEIYMYYGNDSLTSTTIEGIEAGFLSSDIMFKANKWGGSGNPGEATIAVTELIDASSTSRTIGVLRNGVATIEDGSEGEVQGYIMYSDTDVYTRFSSPAWSTTANAEHFVGVAYIGGQWYYDNNSVLTAFTPVSTDLLVARATWGTTDGVTFIEPLQIGEEEPQKVWENYKGVWHMSHPEAIGETEVATLTSTIDGGITGTITFNKTYTNPVVIVYLRSYNGSQSAGVRVRNLTSTGCEVFMQEPDHGTHATEEVHYMVIEAGVHYLPDGTMIEAGTVDTDEYHYTGEVFGGPTVSLSHEFSSTPVVLHTLNTHNNADFTETVAHNVTTTSFQVEQEFGGAGGTVTTETIGWVAIDSGVASDWFETGRGNPGVGVGNDETPYTITFQNDYGQQAKIFVKGQTANGQDGYWARSAEIYNDFSTTTHKVYAEEDQVADTERAHTDETFGWLILRYPGSFYGYRAVEDSSSYGNHGQPLTMQAGSANWVEGQINEGIYMGGGNDVIDVAKPESITDGDFTVSIWAKQEGADNAGAFSQNVPNNWVQDLFIFYIGDTNTNDEVRIYWDGATVIAWAGNGGGATGVFNLYTLTRSGSSLTLYKNGSQVATGTASTNFTSTHQLIAGADQSGEYLTQNYAGTLDEIKMIDVAKSVDWIETEYNNQNSPATFYSVGAEEIPTYTQTYTDDAELHQQFTLTHTDNSLLRASPETTYTDDAILRAEKVVGGGESVDTYYFDGSGGISDPDNVWSNEANGFDGDTNTQTSSDAVEGSSSTNYIEGLNTNAPSSGGEIVEVRGRVHDMTIIDVVGAHIYSDGVELADLAGDGADTWGGYKVLDEPSGGWTWGKLQNLTVKSWPTSAGLPPGSSPVVSTFSRVELEVTSVNDTSYTDDALLHKSFTSTFTDDAVLASPAIEKTFTDDVILRSTQTATHTDDSVLRSESTLTHTDDSLLKEVIEATFTDDALIIEATLLVFSDDAVLMGVYTQTFTDDVELHKTFTTTLTDDAVLRLSDELTHTDDTLLRSQATLTFTDDALIEAESEVTFTDDAVLRLSDELTISDDAYLKGQPEKTITDDVVLRAVQSVTYSDDAVILHGGALSLSDDALLRVDVEITFSDDALLHTDETVTHTEDALLRVRTTDEYTDDAVLWIKGTVTYKDNARLVVEIQKALVDGEGAYNPRRDAVGLVSTGDGPESGNYNPRRDDDSNTYTPSDVDETGSWTAG